MKKIIFSFCLAVALMSSVLSVCATGTTIADWGYDTSYIRGDANNDYKVDIRDIVRIKKNANINLFNADLNGDDTVDALDLNLLRKELFK